MANKRPPFQIPDVIDPPNRRCVQIEIPDDTQHITIFAGLIKQLTDWQRWEREPTKSATLVAQVWRRVFYNIDWGGEDCMGCCPEPTNQRYTDEGILEQSFDGGQTWETARDQDPRFNAPLLPPLTSDEGDDRRCEAANNVAGYVFAMSDEMVDTIAGGAALFGVIAALIAVVALLLSVGTFGALSPLLIGVVSAVIAFGGTAFGAQMTEDVESRLVCIVYCNTPPDGEYTEANWQQIKAEVLSEFTIPAEVLPGKFIHDAINAAGLAGLVNASRTGVHAGQPCDECGCADEWCYTFDFTADDGEWEKVLTNGNDNGLWGVGGWGTTDHLNTATTPDSANRLVYIQLAGLAETVYTRILVTYDYVRGTFDSGALSGHFVSLGGITKIGIPFNDMVDGMGQTSEWIGSQGGTTSIQIWLRSSRDISSPYTYDGSATIKSIRLEGTGNNPFGLDNCS